MMAQFHICLKPVSISWHASMWSHGRKPLKGECISLVQKVEARIAAAKGKYLSFWGRLSLIDTVLIAIFIYYMSIFKQPICIVGEVDRCGRSFFWVEGMYELSGYFK